jgi:hypothetical protein
MPQYLVERGTPPHPLLRVTLFEAYTPYPSFAAYGAEWLVIPAASPDDAAAYAEAYFAGALPDQAEAEAQTASIRTIATSEGSEFAKMLLLGG